MRIVQAQGTILKPKPKEGEYMNVLEDEDEMVFFFHLCLRVLVTNITVQSSFQTETDLGSHCNCRELIG